MSKAKGASPGRTAASRPKTARQQENSTKRRGELSELAFVYKAASLDFGVAKPCGDCERYDVILDSRIKVDLIEQYDREEHEEKYGEEVAEPDFPHQLWRVQVKSTTQLLNGQYRLNAHRRINGRAVPYRPCEVDFLAAHIVPEDAWFIIPIRHTGGRTSLFFSPKDSRRSGLYDAYREAWHLLRRPP